MDADDLLLQHYGEQKCEELNRWLDVRLRLICPDGEHAISLMYRLNSANGTFTSDEHTVIRALALLKLCEPLAGYDMRGKEEKNPQL